MSYRRVVLTNKHEHKCEKLRLLQIRSHGSYQQSQRCRYTMNVQALATATVVITPHREKKHDSTLHRISWAKQLNIGMIAVTLTIQMETS